ncbi:MULTISPECIES: 3'-5' exonuclease [Halomonas]|uniref:3'-5' exonuclease n=2 Tax=Halomonas TaxID=2745 RepID=A0AAU7KFF3_9GAMM|nr:MULTISPECIES: 3'-5' exonuclease [Halomonas]MBR9770400.1 3'-5' exonuclease [Gammaproteobacteria bacterium]HAR07332.1 DNA polymerase III subunit epsilon [Cobetia sp.]KJZ16864.1 DNA polymerase III subunit epsilon [Halomonas sp. S2151]MAR72066.1 DNA polymerase III subunit epsilon [Halomonas sp.]MBR9879607.1 3'-5' exonuclease [Gammaproteobacteria bacterium]|tara:strand:- start:215 stop:937 length:723 start_codon:yes stop_codon:yes gene_type:complete
MPLLRPKTRSAPDWHDYLVARRQKSRQQALVDFFAGADLSPILPIQEAPLMALDLETTGLDPRRDEIVSIGLVPFSLSRIRLAERRYWVVRPHRTLNAESVTFHHITHADIQGAPRIEEVLADVFRAMAGHLLVVHFRHIERSFLDAAVRAAWKESLSFPVIDTMSLEARIHRQSTMARFRRWMGRPPRSIRLHDSRLRYGLPHYHGHHALTDAIATAELLQAQVAGNYGPETPIGMLWS